MNDSDEPIEIELEGYGFERFEENASSSGICGVLDLELTDEDEDFPPAVSSPKTPGPKNSGPASAAAIFPENASEQDETGHDPR